MADSASLSITVDASPEACWAVATAFERYPEWAHDVKQAVVRSRDDLGRATQVEFRASALGRSTHYTLAYDYSEAPRRLSWTMVRGDIMRVIDGAYTFTPIAGAPGEGSDGPAGGTEVRYDLSIDLVVPLPGFVKRRAEVRILNTVKELKVRAET